MQWSFGTFVMCLAAMVTAFPLFSAHPRDGGCDLEMTAVAQTKFEALRQIGHIAVVFGRPRAGSTTFARNLSVKHSSVPLTSEQDAELSSVLSPLFIGQSVVVRTTADDTVIVVDLGVVDTVCKARSFAVLSVLPSTSFWFLEHEVITPETTRSIDMLSRVTEIFRSSLDDPDSTALIRSLDKTWLSATSENASTLPTAKVDALTRSQQSLTGYPSKLTVVASKSDECNMESQITSRLMQVVKCSEYRALDNCEVADGLLQLFAKHIAGLVLHHRRLCPNLPSVDVGDLSIQAVSSNDVTELLSRLTQRASCCFPILPTLWAGWSSALATVALESAVRKYWALSQWIDSSTALLQTQYGNADMDRSLVLSEALRRGPPSANDFARAKSAMAVQVRTGFEQILLGRPTKEATARLNRLIAEEERKVEVDLKRKIADFLIHLAEHCADMASKAPAITKLPVAQSVIDNWRASIVRVCRDSILHTKSGYVDLIGSSQYDSIMAKLIKTLVNLADGVNAQNSAKLSAMIDSVIRGAVDTVFSAPKSAMPASQLQRICSESKQRIGDAFANRAREAIGIWVVDEVVFHRFAKSALSELITECERAQQTNAKFVFELLSKQAAEASEEVKRRLSVIKFPVMISVLKEQSQTIIAEATVSFRRRTSDYSDDELSPHMRSFESRNSALVDATATENVRQWSLLINPVKRCALDRLKAEQYEQSWYSPQRYSTWLIEWRRRAIVDECHEESGRGKVPSEVLSLIVEQWEDDEQFRAVKERAASSFQIALVLCVALVAAVFYFLIP